MLFSLASLVVAIDTVLGWVQEDPRRWPRRLTHAMTEPALRPTRSVVMFLRAWPGIGERSPRAGESIARGEAPGVRGTIEAARLAGDAGVSRRSAPTGHVAHLKATFLSQ